MLKLPRVDEREVFFEKCDCGQAHEKKFIEGVLLNDDGEKNEFTAALVEHERERYVWICFFLTAA